jgi:hypothetical protein
MRFIAIGAMLAFAVASGGVALAQSKCDSAITKAAGKKAACKAGVNAKAQQKGGSPDPAKLAKCSAKFDKACTKAKGNTKSPCSAQSQSCAAIEAEVDSCVTTISASPSGAFLN